MRTVDRSFAIEQRPTRYLRSPHLRVEVDGSARLAAIAWDGSAEESVVEWTLDSYGAPVGEPEIVARGRALFGLCVGDELRVQCTAEDDLATERAPWRARVVHLGAVSEVRVARDGGDELCVWRARGTAVAPDVRSGTASCGALRLSGAWIAFHHNVREDSGTPDIAKWIELRFVSDDGRVFAPTSAMTDRDRDRDGEEQSFEFPQLVVGEDGAVDIFGRGSHTFFRQRASADGFEPRAALDNGAWGCRGRRASVTRVGDEVWCARRARHAIEIGVYDAPTGGPPDVAPCAAEPHEFIANVSPNATANGTPGAWDGPQTLFGDIQQHSAHSDGIGSADEPYLRAREQYGDDFAALTDHESFLGKRTGPGEWEYLQAVAEKYNDPGRFATIVAYEWTGKMFPGPGHKCVYLPGPGFPIVSRDDVPEGRDLVNAIRAHDAITGPHHIAWTGADEPGHAPDVQPIWEICSCHGCYEVEGNPLGYRGDHHDQLAKPMLDKGLRFGFIANSDSHGLLWHHGECRKRDPFRTGLTAVQTSERTRAAILAAIRARRCYATSGAKILLDVRVNGAPMGSELNDEPGDVEVRAIGTTAITRIDLVGVEGVLHSTTPDRSAAAGCVRTRATIRSRYVYARVTQDDGEMAWSSPVWFG